MSEERLQQSERRLRALTDAAAEIVWFVDPAGNITSPIPALEQFTGRSFAELSGRQWIEAIHPDDRESLLSRWTNAMHAPAVFDLEYRMHRADGAWRLMQARGAPVIGGDGEVLEWVGVNVDVTERHAMELELRASERRLARAQEITGIGIWEMDGETMQTIVSENVWAMHGLQDAQSTFTHDDWLAALEPDDRAAANAGLAAALRDGVPYRRVSRFTRPDGTILVAEARAERVIDRDGRTRLLGTMQDVSEREARDAALRESEQRLALIFNSAFDSMFLMSVEGGERFVLRLVNAAFTRITGVAPEAVIDKEIREISRDHAAVQVQRYLDAVRTRAEVEFEERYELGGREQVMETRLIPVIGPAGAVTHILGTSRDISERRRIELERQALTAQLQHAQKLESLGVLAGGVAHDFNNLLVGILGNASLALLDLPPGSEVAEMVTDIEHTARQAAELTNQLLAYSGKGRFVVSAVHLGQLVSEMSPVWRSALSKRARVVLALAERIPPVRADVVQLRQVVLNMMTNASDALGDGAGTITVRTGVVSLDAAALRSALFSTGAAPGEFAYLEVVDDGIGMTDETIARIFDPFFTTKFTGRGLGLAATLGIVRGHEGVITVRSAPGEGTTFRVALPARRDLVVSRSSPAAGTLTAGAGTVLVIDDEAGVRAAVRRILERAGYATMEASDGREGIATFSANRAAIDCVVVDLTMPGLGGVEVVEQVRALRPDVRIVVASGFDAGTVNGLEPAQHVFLHKPFTAVQLIEAVRAGHGS